MTCGHCRSSVEKSLNQIPGVQATVSLDPPLAIIDAAHPVELQILQNAVANAGNYSIADQAASTSATQKQGGCGCGC